MSISTKKIVAIALSAATAVTFAGGIMVASAQTVDIASLLAQIQALQAQIAQLQGSSTAAVSTTFTKDLTLGSKGTEVSALQQILINKGYLTAVSAPTGYFGNATKAAVSAWQAASGITPTAGYFGSKSRAVMAASMASTTGTTGTTTGGTVVVAPATGLAVSLASNNPAAGSLIAGAGRVPVLAFNLTAGNSGAVNVNQISVHKTGVISDSNISGAYLVQSGKVVAQYTSLNNGTISFSNLGWTIQAGQTQSYTVAIDVSSGVTAGNTVGFAMNAATDVVAADASNNAVTASGSFPLNGNMMTASTVSNPSLATLTITSSTVGNSVYAGTQGVLVSSWTTAVNNNPVLLNSIKFRVIGSANKSDLQNVKLMINGTQVGSTLSAVSASGDAYFDLSAAPATLKTGNSTMQIYADVMGSPSFTFQFEVLNTYDVYATDSQYNTSLTSTVNGGTGTQVTILQGNLTVSLSTDSPTGNVAKGQSSVTLAKFKIYAAGEAVKVKFLDFNLTIASTGLTMAGVSNEIKNISLVDDAGSQVGTTISTPGAETTQACDKATANVTGTVYSSCFGTPTSPVNYIIPANTTRILSLKGDIQTGAHFSSVIAALSGQTSANLQGLISSGTNTSGSVTGSSLTLAANAITTAANASVGNMTVAKNTQGQRIGSYSLSASAAEGVNVSNVSITVSNNAGSSFQNMKLMVGGAQYGITQTTVSGSGVYTFSGTPFLVPSGQTTNVDVYADILSNAVSASTTLSGCTGTGQTSLSSVSCSSTAGQTASIGGAAAITVGVSGNPAATQIVAGTTQAQLANFLITETTGNEDVNITSLNVFQATATSSTKAAFSNLTLYNGTTAVGTAGTASASANNSTAGAPTSTTFGSSAGYLYAFNFTTPVKVTKSQSISLMLKGDVPTWSTGGTNFTDNATSTFGIATSTDSSNATFALAVVGKGASSQVVATTTLSSATGNTMTLVRSNLTIATAGLGSASGRAKNTIDDVGTVTFTANNAGSVSLNKVILTISGTLASSTTFGTSATSSGIATSDIVLFDPSTGAAIAPLYSASSTPGTTSGMTVTFNLVDPTATSSNAGYIISAGASKTFNIRVNSLTRSFAAPTGVSATLGVSLNTTTAVAYTDSTDGTGNQLNLPATVVPVSINSVSYSSGT